MQLTEIKTMQNKITPASGPESGYPDNFEYTRDIVTGANSVHQSDKDLPARFPVGEVIPSNDENPYESPGFAGTLASGVLKVGDSLLVIPGNRVANIKSISEGGQQLQQAYPGQLIVIQLSNNLPVERGSMFVKLNGKFPKYSSKVTLIVCWLHQEALKTGARYIVRHTTDETKAVVESIRYKVDPATLENRSDDKNVAFNDIAHITIKAEKPFKYDDYSENRTTGSLLFIDETTLETVGTGMIVSDPEVYSYNI
jgi:sulfate adenylyltransferase subunit 1